MKFKLTATQLIVISVILFLTTNIFIWTSVTRRISIYTQNVLYLATLIKFDRANNDATSFTSKRLAEFLDVHNNYFQSRLIDVSGKEIIRAERSGNSVLLLGSDELQYKGDRYYFKEALQLPKGDVFVSSLDLNEEDGKIEKPYRPTVRFFSPVFGPKGKIGVVGLNLNVKNWFHIFEDAQIGVLNSRNEIYFDKENSLYKKFGHNLDEKDVYGRPIYFSKKISLESNQQWTLFTRPNSTILDAKLNEYKSDTYKTGVALSAGVFFLLFIVQILQVKNRNISKLNRSIENRLTERDTLIKEIHHRVKNNLQVVASLLSLQSSFIKDEQIKMLFRYSQYRINSMGIVHEMLYKSDDLNRIDYGAYIRELVNVLIMSMKGDKSKIALVTEVKNIFLNIDTSIPLGLMVNEIITNYLKYGFSDSEEGTITVMMNKLSTFTYELKIGDNGSGIPSHVNFRNTKSLGLKLIHKLALQLHGNIEMDNSKIGTNYIITFQEIEQTS